MINSESIYTTIRKMVADKIDAGVSVRQEWIAAEYMAANSDIQGSDADVYRYCTRFHISRIATQCIAKYGQPVSEEQYTLEGFKHLQVAYPVEREGHRELVPVHKLSNEELLNRAAEYDDMARGCRAHAKEIRGYVKSRIVSTVAA